MPLDSLAEALYDVVMTPLWFIYILTLSRDWRYSRPSSLRIISLFILGITALELVLYAVWGPIFATKLAIAVFSLAPGMAVILIVSRQRGWRMAFLFFTSAVFILLGESLCDALGFSSFLGRFLAKAVIYALIFLFLYSFRSSLGLLLDEIKTGWGFLALVPISLFCCFCFLVVYGKTVQGYAIKLTAFLFSLATFMIYIAFSYLFGSLREQFQLKENWNLLQSQITALERESSAIYRAGDEIRIFRHDMRHFMQMQAGCLNSGDLEGAKKALDSMGENLDGIVSQIQIQSYTRRPLMDSVLSQYAKRAEVNGIEMAIRLDLPEQLPADPADLAVVIGNGLENAFHACLEIPEEKGRHIRVYGGQNQSQFCLEIANTFVGKIQFNEDRTLPLAKKAGHGYGTRSIAAFAKKYDALVDYETVNGWFKIRILF